MQYPGRERDCQLSDAGRGGSGSHGVVSDRARRMLWPALILVVGALIYSNTFGNAFVFDDAGEAAVRFRSLRLTPNRLTPRGLVTLSFAVNSMLDPGQPAGYHAVNLAVHLAAGLVLYGLLRRTFLMPVCGRWANRMAEDLAGASALLWTAHPLQTESVAYISQRCEIVAGLFVLLTLYGLARWGGAGGSLKWGRISVASCFLGMWSKETAVVAPVLAGLYDFVFIGRSGDRTRAERFRYYAMLALSWVFLAELMLMRAAVSYDIVTGPGPAVSRMEYLMTQAEVIPHYLALVFRPVGLCLDYAWPPVGSFREVALPALALAAAAVLSLWGLMRRRPEGFLGAWFFSTLAPSSSMVPLSDLAFEHRMYLPLAAVIAGVVMLSAGLGYRVRTLAPRFGRALTVSGWMLLAILVAAEAYLTRERNTVYADSVRMARNVLESRPRNLRQRLILAKELMKRGEYGEAERYARSLLEEMRLARRNPGEGWLRVGANHVDGLMPGTLNVLAVCLMRRGETREARACLEEAIRLAPSAEFYHNLGVALFQDGLRNEAEGAVDSALALAPRRALSLAFKGFMLAEQGRFREAVASYRAALAADPESPDIKAEMAWLLATAPDAAARNGNEALSLARELRDRSRAQNSRIADLLAAAHAECGQWDEAVRAEDEAIRLALAESAPPDYIAGLRARMSLYLARQPCRRKEGLVQPP